VMAVHAVALEHQAAAEWAGAEGFRSVVCLHVHGSSGRTENSGQIEGMLFQVS
jgi:hypothetical protein